jgi:hypothetical protein
VFERARNYEAIPIPPSEEYTVLYFAEKSPTDPKEKRAIRPELSFIWIDRAPVRTGPRRRHRSGPTKAAAGQGQARRSAAEGDRLDRALHRPALARLVLGQPIEAKERDGFKAREFNLLRKKNNGHTAWMMAYDNGKRTLAILGMCHEKDLRSSQDLRYTAEHIDIKEPEEKSPEKTSALLRAQALKGIDERIQVRLDMVRGWKAEDPSTSSSSTTRPTSRWCARSRATSSSCARSNEKLFPPAKPVEAVSAVRVCKSRDEYFSYGGPRARGYWNSVDKELVFYDAEKTDSSNHSNDADTFIALYHEAFHPVHLLLDRELPPHSWFNEGHGDFFSGAQIRTASCAGSA